MELAFGGGGSGGTGDDNKLTTEMQLQEEIAGDDVHVRFHIQGQPGEYFLEQVFKNGQTFEWVKHNVAQKLEARYADLALYYNGKRIPEPFCLVDMGIQNGTVDIAVEIASGAVIGYEEVRKQVEREIEQDQ